VGREWGNWGLWALPRLRHGLLAGLLLLLLLLLLPGTAFADAGAVPNVSVCVGGWPHHVQAGVGSSKSLSAAELLSLLRSDISMEDVPQSGAVGDDMLERLLDRSWMIEADEQQAQGDTRAAAAAAGAEQQQSGGGAAGAGKWARRRTVRVGAAAAAPAPAGGAAGDAGAGSNGRAVQGGLPYPPQGVGYEVVQAMEDSGLLSNVN